MTMMASHKQSRGQRLQPVNRMDDNIFPKKTLFFTSDYRRKGQRDLGTPRKRWTYQLKAQTKVGAKSLTVEEDKRKLVNY